MVKTPHTHTNACYTTRNICGTPAHRHYGGCKRDGKLVCGQAVHTHDHACQQTRLTCGR